MRDFLHTFNLERVKTIEHGIIYRGFTMDDAVEVSQWIPAEFTEVPKWADGTLRRVWVSPRDMAVITFCEGDIILETWKTMDNYKAEIEKIDRFYQHH